MGLAESVAAFGGTPGRVRAALILTSCPALTSVAGWVLGGLIDPGPGVVRARQFVVVDREGRERALLEVTDGSPQLVLYDGGILPRLALFARPGGASGLALYDRVGARATLT